jgi:hypothetical protein
MAPNPRFHGRDDGGGLRTHPHYEQVTACSRRFIAVMTALKRLLRIRARIFGAVDMTLRDTTNNENRTSASVE